MPVRSIGVYMAILIVMLFMNNMNNDEDKKMWPSD